MSQKKKLIQTKAEGLSSDVLEAFMKEYPLLVLVKNYNKDGSSSIRLEIQDEEELVKALVEFAKTGNGLPKVDRFILHAITLLGEARYQILKLSQLN